MEQYVVDWSRSGDRAQLELEREVREERHRTDIDPYKAMGAFAPTRHLHTNETAHFKRPNVSAPNARCCSQGMMKNRCG
jgi:hypothetical protein